MISYFKYDDGNAFTLNGSDYAGFFNTLSGTCYSGRTFNTSSEVLVPKNNFLSEMFTKKMENHSIYQDVDQIFPVILNAKEPLNKTELTRIFSRINTNNLTVYSDLIIGNPTIFSYNPNNHYYSFPNESSLNDDGIPVNTTRTAYPLFTSDKWKFLDNVTAGALVVDTNENFKYICSDLRFLYVLSGSFVTNDPLVLLSSEMNSPEYDSIVYIHNDIETERLYVVRQSRIDIYDSSNFETCDNFILIDSITVDDDIQVDTRIWDLTHVKWEEAEFPYTQRFFVYNSENPEFMKIGSTIRTKFSDDTLYLLSKNSNKVLQTIDLASYNIEQLLDIAIRTTDDCVLLIFKSDDKFYTLFFDPSDFSSTVNQSELLNLNPDSSWYKIQFSDLDSNCFHIISQYDHQTRWLTKPIQPWGRLTSFDLKYPIDYIWDLTDEFPEFFDIVWNTSDDVYNTFIGLNTTFTSKNGKFYMIQHNLGRVYALSEDNLKFYWDGISRNVPKNYIGIDDSETSIGVYFNTVITDLLQDTVDLNNKCFYSFQINEFDVEKVQITDLNYSVFDLNLNGNESVNVATLQRIASNLFDLQDEIITVSS